MCYYFLEIIIAHLKLLSQEDILEKRRVCEDHGNQQCKKNCRPNGHKCRLMGEQLEVYLARKGKNNMLNRPGEGGIYERSPGSAPIPLI